MKLVIDISDETYEDVKKYENMVDIEVDEVAEAIVNGTPLPKGHGDLKDADIYKAEVYKYIAENKNSDDLYLAGCGDGAYHALHIYDCIPTIIESDKLPNNELENPFNDSRFGG